MFKQTELKPSRSSADCGRHATPSLHPCSTALPKRHPEQLTQESPTTRQSDDCDVSGVAAGGRMSIKASWLSRERIKTRPVVLSMQAAAACL
ncbi:hypothetical protein FA95DRAFT_1613573 [Auriscalpium vulgare]|uniref:Uncharacterized protein n=1 Tax=Auriscalpium vulgare TaxID=40419 RepID=A0ACB8R2F7_9AGAM|nr:hypothetical protein FA95DRAFT_1613573 [Auriscalpium vulgare]